MNRTELLATVELLCDVEIDVLERDELADVVAVTARVRGWLDATELRCTRRGRKLADDGHAEPAPALIARKGNRSNRDANQIDRRNKVAEAMPSFEDGLGDGTVSAGHLDAIANATRNATPEVRAAFAAHEDELLALAAGDTVEMFTGRCRALVAQLTAELTGNDASELDRQRAESMIRRWVDPANGMCHTHAALDPLRDEILWNALNRSLRRRQQRDGNARTPWNQMQVDALIDAVLGGAAHTSPRARPASGPTAGSRTAPTTTPTATPTAAPTAAPAGPDPSTSTRPPSPAADIARHLANAIDRATASADEHRSRRCHAPAPQSDTADAAIHASSDTHTSDEPSDESSDEPATRRHRHRHRSRPATPGATACRGQRPR